MTSVRRIEEVAAAQYGLVARWQLSQAGWGATRIRHALRDLRRVHDGVYVTGAAPLTDRQRQRAATLTAPRTVLSHFSAAACWGLKPARTTVQSVTRPGRTSPRQHGLVLIHYSATLPGNVTKHDDIPITSPARTVLDQWPHLSPSQADRLLRDAIRLKLTTHHALRDVIGAHRGRRGIASLRAVSDRYARLPLDRCRSDAEVEGLVILDDAGVAPEVNVERAGIEADFSWAARRLIVEIDGPGFHVDPLEDARKTRVWTRAGWEVRRIPSPLIYAEPLRLLALVSA